MIFEFVIFLIFDFLRYTENIRRTADDQSRKMRTFFDTTTYWYTQIQRIIKTYVLKYNIKHTNRQSQQQQQQHSKGEKL